MKKLAFTLSVFLFCIAGVKAQSFSSGHLTVSVTDTMVHDSTLCRTNVFIYYHIYIDSSYTGQIVNVVDTNSGSLIGTFTNASGSSPWSFVTNAGGASSGASYYGIHDYNLPGGYAHTSNYYVSRKIVAGYDTVFATAAHDSLLVTNPCEYSTISGDRFADNNGNCVYDAGDDALSFPLSDIEVNSTFAAPGTGVNFFTSGSTAGPSYTKMVQKSWMTTCTVSVPSYYYFVYSVGTCAAGPYVFTSLPATGADFPFNCTSNVDVQCGACSPGSVRLHTPFLLHPYVSNTGCSPAGGQMKLIKDPHVVYNPALSSHPADAVSGDTLIWNYSGLTNIVASGYWNSFMAGVHLTPDATVVVGDTLCFRILTNVPAADINASNNDQSFCFPVVYSYDPNMKEVLPKGTGPEGFISGDQDTLQYTIHFQNTGSAPAIDVKIVDTLDSDIDPASLKILGSTHKMTPKWLSSTVVQFSYPNINLPDSLSNEPASHGAVRFSVKLKAGLPIGTKIRNTGYIYFDLNPPVITNTALNTLSNPTTVSSLTSDIALRIYPNPATNQITVENLDQGEISIMNISGSVVLRHTVSSSRSVIDISRLPAGVYILRSMNTSVSDTRKFIKY